MILGSIHGVKGIEFKNVYVINCVEETIPHASSIKENIEEERRLFYVGITSKSNRQAIFIFSNKQERAV